MHLGHQVRPGLDQHLVAALEVGAAEVRRRQAEQLQVRAHGAVEDDHAPAQCVEVRGGGRIEPSEQFRGAVHHPSRIPGAFAAT